MNRPVESLAPGELAIAGKAFDATLDRLAGSNSKAVESPAVKQDIAAKILGQVAAGNSEVDAIVSHTIEQMMASGAVTRGAK